MAHAQTWTQTSAPSNFWNSFVCSADGSKLAALAGTNFYTSTNSGVTWISNNFRIFIDGSILAASADETHLVAATDNSGEIDVSTNSGLTWKKSTNYIEAAWESIASSADGEKLVLTESSALTRVSTNGGATWYPLATFPNDGSDPQYAAMSADGNSLTVVTLDYVFTTTNFGQNWITNILTTPCRQMAASADGQKLITAPYGGNIYTSTNFGATWTQQTNSPSLLWWYCASSADGTKLAAVSGISGGADVIYTSTDSGTTWISNNVPGQQWAKIVSSADGNKLFAIVNGNDPGVAGGIWTLQTTPSPPLNLLSSNTTLNFSWIVPSTNMVLEESPDLSNWTPLTNLPSLNDATLQQNLTVSETNCQEFFRLVSQ